MLLFTLAFFAFAYFHQGGGWNQNSRFAMVRALVEEGHPWIDSFLIYQRSPDGAKLRRTPVHDGKFVDGGKTRVLLWGDSNGHSLPVNGQVVGAIRALDGASNSLRLQVTKGAPAEVPVVLTPATEIRRGSTALALGDLRESNVVTAECVLDELGRTIANKINVTDDAEPPDVGFVGIGEVAVSGDVAFYGGHFHPNKAPGTSFAALPAYFLIYHLERAFGADPDEWWTLTRNAWLTSVFSVGLFSALGVVVFFALTLSLSGGRTLASAFATIAFALGTMFFPYGTMLYEHNLVTVALLASIFFLRRTRDFGSTVFSSQLSARQTVFSLYLGGLFAGCAAITNYIIAVIVIFLALYVALAGRRKDGLLWFGLGLLGPFIAICCYNAFCFATPFTTNYSHQNPQFSGGATAALSVLVSPRWDVLMAILISPFRGLFFSAPILLAGIHGLVVLFRSRSGRAEAWLILSSVIFVLLFNMSFNAWAGGWTTVPRYLAPAVPFLALPTVFAFIRFFKTTCTFAALSLAVMLLTTTVDPQSPVGTALTVRGKPAWQYNPLTQYEAPLFWTGRAGPFFREMEASAIEYFAHQLQQKDLSPTERDQQIEQFRQYVAHQIASGEPAPLVLLSSTGTADPPYGLAATTLTAVKGPVSANSMGAYEGWMGRLFPASSSEARWNSFNFGELFFPESRWSLAPLLFGCGALGWLAVRIARQIDSKMMETRSAREL